MSIFKPVDSFTEVNGTLVRKQLTVPAPANCVGHFVVDTSKKLIVVFITPKKGELTMAHVEGRVSAYFTGPVTWYSGQGCFSTNRFGQISPSGYVVLGFIKTNREMGWLRDIAVKELEPDGTEKASQSLHSLVKPVVGYELVVPPNLANFYKVESFSELLKADFYTPEEIRTMWDEEVDLRKWRSSAPKSGAGSVGEKDARP